MDIVYENTNVIVHIFEEMFKVTLIFRRYNPNPSYYSCAIPKQKNEINICFKFVS